MPRIHGFEPPLDPHQMASWAAAALFALSYYVLYAPVHTNAGGVVCTVLYSLSVIGTIVSAVWCMKTDPSDPGLRAKREAALTGAALPPPAEGAVNYCYLCEVNVFKRSKHCRRCNKCVDIFDHHCPWLNTCVGQRNYPYFLALLASFFSLTTIELACFAHALIRLATARDTALAEMRATYEGLPELAYAILLSLTLLLVLGASFLIMQLATFHIGLIYKGHTTYEFIVAQRQKHKARDAARGAAYVPTLRDHIEGWVSRNAPCLAVCELCEAPPAGRSAAKDGGGKESGGKDGAGATPAKTPGSARRLDAAPPAAADAADHQDALPQAAPLPPPSGAAAEGGGEGEGGGARHEPALDLDLHGAPASAEPPEVFDDEEDGPPPTPPRSGSGTMNERV